MIRHPFIPIQVRQQVSAQATAFNTSAHSPIAHYSNTLPTTVIQAKHCRPMPMQTSTTAKPALLDLTQKNIIHDTPLIKQQFSPQAPINHATATTVIQQKKTTTPNSHINNSIRINSNTLPIPTTNHVLQTKPNPLMNNMQTHPGYHPRLSADSIHKQNIHPMVTQTQKHLFYSQNASTNINTSTNSPHSIPRRYNTLQTKSNPLQQNTGPAFNGIIPRRFNSGIIQFAKKQIVKRFGSYARDILNSAKAKPQLRRVPLIKRIEHSSDLSLMNAHVNLTQEMHHSSDSSLVSRLKSARQQTGMELSKRLKLTKAALRHFEKLPHMDFVSPGGIIYEHDVTPQGDPNRLIHLIKHNEHNWSDPTFGGKKRHNIFTDPSSQIMPVTSRPTHPDIVSYMDEILDLFHQGDSSVEHHLSGIRDNLIHIPDNITGYEAGKLGIEAGLQPTYKTRLVLQRPHGSTSVGNKLITGYPQNISDT